MIIAHRGNGVNLPENSFEAIYKCFKTGFIDGVEFDVRITKDKKLVLIHDMIIDRVSNGSGLVSNYTYKELLDFSFNGSKICLLEDILNIETDKIFLIELKLSDKEYFMIKKYLIKLLIKYSYKKLYVVSFNKSIIRDLKKYNLNIRLFIFSYYYIKDEVPCLINYLFYDGVKKVPFLWTIDNKNDIYNIWVKNSNMGIITNKPILAKDVKDECNKFNKKI